MLIIRESQHDLINSLMPRPFKPLDSAPYISITDAHGGFAEFPHAKPTLQAEHLHVCDLRTSVI